MGKKCSSPNCNTRACYNYNGYKFGLYCSKHKLVDMINIETPTCKVDNCNIIALYNYKDKSNAIYCNTHKLENMINIKSKRCIFENCDIRPTFNLESETTPLYCFTHKLEGMVDVKNNKCIYKGCNRQSIYNYENKAPMYCMDHKLENMINVKYKSCIIKNCNNRPTYNHPYEKKPLYCNIHREHDMIDFRHSRCKECLVCFSNNPKYKGCCFRCFVYKFPYDEIIKNYKVKEKHVVDFIDLHFKEYVESYDKIIKGGCSKRRPDVLIDLLTHSIIIEVDEDQHEAYDSTCENKRMMELFQDLGNRPVVLIRFNPDSYMDDNDKKVKSCFKYHKTLGLPIIENEAKWQARLSVLKLVIEKHIEKIPEKEVTIEQLFFNTKNI